MNKEESKNLSADEALKKLKEGNEEYVANGKNNGDISGEIRSYTCQNGQNPYAVIIGCSDSRAIPEVIFNAGIGDLFVIRVAGNVIDPHQLGSIEYAVHHLGVNLVVVMGHDHCGAVAAAINNGADGHIKSITDDIIKAIGDEKNEYRASCLNAQYSADKIRKSMSSDPEFKIISAVYNIESGKVEYFDK
ncbi:MAG: carbonic anhydrase [Clostridium sp.]|nr:carbonic anhydrase [Clostridium sp.]MCM1547540.1 carbonic anhydrase [Ruminococcus sp.]